jgi:hypothetical protein
VLTWSAYEANSSGRAKRRAGKAKAGGQDSGRRSAQGRARSDTARGDRDSHYLEQYGVDRGRFPRELGLDMHEGGHTGRPYVPRHTRVGRDAPGRGRDEVPEIATITGHSLKG